MNQLEGSPAAIEDVKPGSAHGKDSLGYEEDCHEPPGTTEADDDQTQTSGSG